MAPQPGLNQRAAQVPIAFAGFAAPALSRTFVLARTHGAPATQVARREEPGHIAAGFSHDADRANPIHPRNGVQRRQHRFERDEPLIDLRGQPLQRFVEKIDLGEDLLDEKRVVGAKPSLQRAPQFGQLLPQLAARQLRQDAGSVVPSTSACSMARPLLPMTFVMTVVSFSSASSRTLQSRLTSWLRSRTCWTRYRVKSRKFWLHTGFAAPFPHRGLVRLSQDSFRRNDNNRRIRFFRFTTR
jgi:hypothetical protein